MSFRIDQLAVLNLATVGNSITAGSFVKSGGTSSQFLKADGSVDSSAYITGITSGMVTTALGYTPVPNTRNITINGVTQDLSVDRTWTISAGVSSVSGSGAGISVSPTTGAVVVSNTGVTSNVAGTGISVSGATGAVTITNTGVTSIVAGTAITISGATGAVTINNAGVTSVNGNTGAITGIITTSNYNSYSPTLTGGGASGTWGISITGNSATVSTLATLGTGISYNTDRTVKISNGLAIYGAYNGGANSPWTYDLAAQFIRDSRGFEFSASWHAPSATLAFRTLRDCCDNWSSWVTMLSSSNYNSYSPTLTGGGASGTWSINITGNADTVDNFHASQSTVANNIVVRDANGYIFGNYINMTDDGNPGGGTAISSFITKQGDNYYRSVSPTNAMVSIRGVASGSWGINITGSAGSASSASSVPWTGVTAGTRTNYDLRFQPPSNSYAGFEFNTSTGGGAGYFLVRGTSDNDVYTAEGITLVADAGWLTLAQRTTSDKGVRIMTGSTSTTRMAFNANGTTYLYTDLYLGSTNTRITASDATGYLRIYGSSSNYLAIGPYNNNGWVYFENIANTSGMYFNSPGRYAFDTVDLTPYTDAENSLGNGSFRWSQVYTSGWLRQYGAQGMYNQDYGTHFYSSGTGSWNVTGSGGNVELVFRSNHQSTIRGYVYADTGNNIGFLNNSGNWALRSDSSSNVQIYGALTVGNSTSSDIYMTDTDENTRRIHTNSSRIGFLSTSNSWGSYCATDGSWRSDQSMYAPIFYDLDNSAYYGNFASTSVMNSITFGTSTNGGTISGNSDWGMRLTTSGGYIQFGPANASWAHIYSNLNFYFNQNLYVNGTQVVINSGTWSIDISGNSATTSQRNFSGDISTGGMGRFTGWYNGNAATGLAAEIGISSGEAYIIAYNRQTSSYGVLNLESSAATLRIGGSTVNVVNGSLQQGGNQVLHAGNYTSYTLPIGGGWYGVNMPGSRWGGYAVSGGEIVFGNGLPNAGQMGMLIDGAYVAGENNGFWSLPSNNDWNGRRGMYWDGSYLNFTANSPTSVFTTLRLANGFELQQGGSNYGQFNTWVHLPGFHGLYSAQNSAHFYPNSGTYGSWIITGSRNGWGGIEFGNGSNGSVVVMLSNASNESGFHNNSYGWQIFWSGGALYSGRNTYGGNTSRVLQEDTWISSKYFGSDGYIYGVRFSDSNDSSYFLDPNGTSELNSITTGTRARWGEPRIWTNRQAYTSDQNYWTGTNGWGTGEGNWDNAWKGGFSGWDIWGTGTAHPQGSGYIHAQGIVSGQHYASSDGSSGYGWMMVGAADATANRYWLRGKWGGTTSGWVEMITSGNIGSQNVNYASQAGTASFASSAGNTSSISSATGGSYTWTGQQYFQSNLGGYCGSLSGPPLQAYSTSNNSAFFSFHKSGQYAVNMGLDADSVLRIGGWSAAANRWQLDMSGNMTVAGDVTAYSDARVKENIETVEDALDKVLNLRGVYYNRTDSDDKRRKVGVIAQEILEVIPEVVGQDNDGMYNVSYGNIVGVLIEAIKEQQKQIDELKARLD